MVFGAELLLWAKEKAEFLSDKKRVDIDTTRKFKRQSSLSLLTHSHVVHTFWVKEPTHSTPSIFLFFSLEIFFNFMSLTIRCHVSVKSHVRVEGRCMHTLHHYTYIQSQQFWKLLEKVWSQVCIEKERLRYYRIIEEKGAQISPPPPPLHIFNIHIQQKYEFLVSRTTMLLKADGVLLLLRKKKAEWKKDGRKKQVQHKQCGCDGGMAVLVGDVWMAENNV